MSLCQTPKSQAYVGMALQCATTQAMSRTSAKSLMVCRVGGSSLSVLVSALRNGRSDVRQRDKTPRCVAGCRLPSAHGERLNQRAHESNKRTTQQKAIGSVCVYVLVVLHARAADVSIAHEQDVESLKVVERLSSFGLRTNKQHTINSTQTRTL